MNWLIKLLGGYTQAELDIAVGKSTMALFSDISKRLEESRTIDSYQRQRILFGSYPEEDMFDLDLPTSFKEKSA